VSAASDAKGAAGETPTAWRGGQGHGQGAGMGRMAAHGGMAGRMGARGGMVGPIMGGIEVNAESQKAWKALERLMVKRHRAMWNVFRLRDQEKPDEKAIEAKIKELRDIGAETAAVHQELAKFRRGDAPAFGPGGMGTGDMAWDRDAAWDAQQVRGAVSSKAPRMARARAALAAATGIARTARRLRRTSESVTHGTHLGTTGNGRPLCCPAGELRCAGGQSAPVAESPDMRKRRH